MKKRWLLVVARGCSHSLSTAFVLVPGASMGEKRHIKKVHQQMRNVISYAGKYSKLTV
jgi:hypothetical protein